MATHRRPFTWFAKRTAPVFTLLFLAIPLGCTKGKPTVAPPKAPEVAFVHPSTETVRDYEDYTGRIEALKTENVVPQVSGRLTEILFKDGAEVEAGQDLFVIDPRPFEATLAGAIATVHEKDGDMRRKRILLNRAQELRVKGTNSQEDLDNAKADMEVAVALRDLAEATKKTAELNLEYCHIKSKIGGTISRRNLDPGNQVTAFQTLLTTIVQIDKVYGNFDVDERTLLRLRRAIRTGEIDSARVTKRKLDIGLADEDGFSLGGLIDFSAPMLDPGTGTLRVRVVIDNPTIREMIGDVYTPLFDAFQQVAKFPLKEPLWNSRMLSPNMFVRVRFWIGDPAPAILVPESALVSDQGVRHLFVLGPEDANGECKVEYRSVEIGLQQGHMRVVKSGVKPSDRVVVSGLQRVRPGVMVKATEQRDEKSAIATSVNKKVTLASQ
jgi:multidrug efflux system membrane fusion protein